MAHHKRPVDFISSIEFEEIKHWETRSAPVLLALQFHAWSSISDPRACSSSGGRRLIWSCDSRSSESLLKRQISQKLVPCSSGYFILVIFPFLKRVREHHCRFHHRMGWIQCPLRRRLLQTFVLHPLILQFRLCYN